MSIISMCSSQTLCDVHRTTIAWIVNELVYDDGTTQCGRRFVFAFEDAQDSVIDGVLLSCGSFGGSCHGCTTVYDVQVDVAAVSMANNSLVATLQLIGQDIALTCRQEQYS